MGVDTASSQPISPSLTILEASSAGPIARSGRIVMEARPPGRATRTSRRWAKFTTSTKSARVSPGVPSRTPRKEAPAPTQNSSASIGRTQSAPCPVAQRAIRVTRSAWYMGPTSLASWMGRSAARSASSSKVPSEEPLSITIASSIAAEK